LSVTDTFDADAPDIAEADSLQELVQRWRRVRERLRDRPIPRGSEKRRAARLALLIETLALTWLCACRYRRHSPASPIFKSEYLAYAHEAQCVADEISGHIRTLNPAPAFWPIRRDLALVLTDKEETLVDMVTEDLIVARVAARSCREVMAYLQAHDQRLSALFGEILAIQGKQLVGLTRLYQVLRRSDPIG
jgi:bacterioferritin (cytochrome b1)